MRHTRYFVWVAAGLVLGFACVAYGQDTPVAITAADPWSMLAVQTLEAGGLPAVFGLLGWMLSRWQPTVRIMLVRDDDENQDRRDIRDLLDELRESRDPDRRAEGAELTENVVPLQ